MIIRFFRLRQKMTPESLRNLCSYLMKLGIRALSFSKKRGVIIRDSKCQKSQGHGIALIHIYDLVKVFIVFV